MPTITAPHAGDDRPRFAYIPAGDLQFRAIQLHGKPQTAAAQLAWRDLAADDGASWGEHVEQAINLLTPLPIDELAARRADKAA